ncbi:MAG TPA: hypothetical protein VJ725_28095 [Thermoanaerobaculia bacterium]|nr:hypothetical protein [Thermoanaerobaculia bacterium]
MSTHRPSQLEALEAELDEATARAHRLVERLGLDGWTRRPAPERWSALRLIPAHQRHHLWLAEKGLP